MLIVDPAQDAWRPARSPDDALPQPLHPVAHTLWTWPQWQIVRNQWPADLPAGLEVPNTADPLALAEDLPRLRLIVLQFPKWTDGRAYSQARLLRTRLGFAGEIRATGDVLADMLPLLHRTGFDAVRLRPDQRPETARRALGFFSAHYQGDARQPLPWFGRAA